MSTFGSFFGGSGAAKTSETAASNAINTAAPNTSSADLKRQIQEQVGQELAIANATELVNKITENCFEKCFEKPGTSVSPAEQDCTKKCMEKYMHAWNSISRSYIARIQQAGATGQV